MYAGIHVHLCDSLTCDRVHYESTEQCSSPSTEPPYYCTSTPEFATYVSCCSGGNGSGGVGVIMAVAVSLVV